MPPQHERRTWNVRALLESTATPYTIADYRPRATIFLQGDPCDSVMYIESGRVWLAVTARNGKEAICGLLESGAFLGEDALVGRRERRQSANAMTATRVLVVAKTHMIRLLRTQPGVLDRFIAHLLTRETRLQANLTDHIFHSSEQRLAYVLLVLASCNAHNSRRCALPQLPQEIIAEMVGTTRSRVSVLMGKFKKLGFIEKNSGVLHVNPGRLHVLRDDYRSNSLTGLPSTDLESAADY